jgi:hypothetical protein
MLQSNPAMVHPRCPRCDAAMEHPEVIPGLGGLAQRIFKCPRCHCLGVAADNERDPRINLFGSSV